MSESEDRPTGPGSQDPTFGAFDAARDPWARPPADAHGDETVKLTKDPAPASPPQPSYDPSSYSPPGAEPPTYIPPDYRPPSYDQPTSQQPAYEPPPSYAPPAYPDPGQAGGYGQPYQQPGYPADPYQQSDPYQQYGAPAYGQPAPAPYGYGAQPGYPGSSYAYGPATSGKATAVMILGIASLITVWCYGIGVVPAIVALAMSGSAKREIESSGGRVTGLGMVTAGRVTSWVSIGLTVAFIILIIILAVVSASTTPNYTGS